MITKYEGTAGAFDARVVCIRPILEDWKFSIEYSSDNYTARGIFKGHVRPTELTDEIKGVLRYEHSEPGIPFYCISYDMNFTPDLMFKICTVSDSNGGLINGLDHTSNGSMDHYLREIPIMTLEGPEILYSTWMAPDEESSLQWPVQMGRPFLLLETKGNGIKNNNWDFETSNLTVNDKDVWLRLATDLGSGITAELRVIICFDAQ